MKKLGLVLLVVGVMVLGFGLMTAFAQSSNANTTATVTVTDNNVTMAPTTLPASVPVTFTFTNNGQNAHAFVIEKAGATNQPLTSGGKTASFDAINAGGNFSTTWTFDQPGDYQLAAYKNGTLEQGLSTTFTVASSTGAQAGATASPSATTAATATTAPTATAAATTAASSAVTNTATVTSTGATTSTTGTTPSRLPTTGGETTNWAAMLLAFGVAALVLGGALTFARKSR